MKMCMDAQASKDFIQNTGTSTRMKHIDLRAAWISQLRDSVLTKQLVIEWQQGHLNEADFFTKITSGDKFKSRQNQLMGDLPELEYGKLTRFNDGGWRKYS